VPRAKLKLYTWYTVRPIQFCNGGQATVGG